jgi:hypothetical protein
MRLEILCAKIVLCAELMTTADGTLIGAVVTKGPKRLHLDHTEISVILPRHFVARQIVVVTRYQVAVEKAPVTNASGR